MSDPYWTCGIIPAMIDTKVQVVIDDSAKSFKSGFREGRESIRPAI